MIREPEALDYRFLPHTPPVLSDNWGLPISQPRDGGLQQAAATRAEGLPEAQGWGQAEEARLVAMEREMLYG
jgi:hypothetical protein